MKVSTVKVVVASDDAADAKEEIPIEVARVNSLSPEAMEKERMKGGVELQCDQSGSDLLTKQRTMRQQQR